MLKKLNSYANKIIREAAETVSNKFFDCNEFYFNYIEKAADDLQVSVTKQRENVFLIYGSLKNIKAFFLHLKVDKKFMDNPSDFTVYEPIFTYGEVKHYMNFDEFYPICPDPRYPTQTHQVDNVARTVAEGRWHAFLDDNGKKVKKMKPADITKYLKGFFPKASKETNENLMFYVEFQVDCDGFANQIWGQMTEYAPTPDEMNEMHKEQHDADFNYDAIKQKNITDKDQSKRLKSVPKKKF